MAIRPNPNESAWTMVNARSHTELPGGRESSELPPALLSKATVCQLLDNVTAKHVENLVRSGRMPEPVYLGRSPRWPTPLRVFPPENTLV